MKKLLMVCCFVVSIVSLSKAQGRQQRTPEEQVAQLKTIVPTLTADQSDKALVIYKAQTASRDSVMKASNGDMQTAMGSMRPLMQATQAKIQAILTDDQKAVYAQYQKDHPRGNRGGGGGGMGGGGGTPPPPSQE